MGRMTSRHWRYISYRPTFGATDSRLPRMIMRHPLRWLAREAGLRFLARHKAACGVAVLTMTLALGANTTVFSVVHTFLRGSLAIPEPDRVALIAPVRNLPGRGTVVFAEAFPNYETIRKAQHAFSDVTIMSQNVG